MTAYVKIRQILCAFEEGKVTKKTKTGGYYLYEKEKLDDKTINKIRKA